MSGKILSEAEMAEIEAQIAAVDEKRLERKRRLSKLERDGFDFGSSTIDEDMELWFKFGKKLPERLKAALLSRILEKRDASDSALLLLGSNLSSADLEQLVKAVLDNRVKPDVLKRLESRVVNLWSILFDGTFYKYRERSLLLLELIKRGVVSNELFGNMRFKWGWQSAGREIVAAITEGWMPEKVLQKMCAVKEFEFEPVVMVAMLEAAMEGKFQLSKVLGILGSKTGYRRHEYSELIVPMLVEALSDGRLSDAEFRVIMLDYNLFADEDWKKLYNSHRDFLVRAYLRKFYPDIKVKI